MSLLGKGIDKPPFWALYSQRKVLFAPFAQSFRVAALRLAVCIIQAVVLYLVLSVTVLYLTQYSTALILYGTGGVLLISVCKSGWLPINHLARNCLF